MADRERQPAVAIIGSTHVDLVAHASRLPVRGETLPGFGFAIHPGGKGGNQAVAVARAGARAILFGRIGRDDFGVLLTTRLSAAGVELQWVGIDDTVSTGCSTVLTGEGGDYASIIVPGASLHLSPAHMLDAAEVFSEVGVVVGQLEIDPATTTMAMELGRKSGATTILNAAPAPERGSALLGKMLAAVDILVVNTVEAAMLLDRPPDAKIDAITAAEDLQRAHDIETVVVTVGEAGLVARHGRQTISRAGIPVTPMDTIGAGDAFIGALAAALASGDPIEIALERANAAGAIAVTRSGGFDAAPTAAEIDQMLADLSRTG